MSYTVGPVKLQSSKLQRLDLSDLWRKQVARYIGALAFLALPFLGAALGATWSTSSVVGGSTTEASLHTITKTTTVGTTTTVTNTQLTIAKAYADMSIGTLAIAVMCCIWQLGCIVVSAIRSGDGHSGLMNLHSVRDVRSRAITAFATTVAALYFGCQATLSNTTQAQISYRGGMACAVVACLICAFQLHLANGWHESEMVLMAAVSGKQAEAAFSGYYDSEAPPFSASTVTFVSTAHAQPFLPQEPQPATTVFVPVPSYQQPVQSPSYNQAMPIPGSVAVPNPLVSAGSPMPSPAV